MDGRIRYLIPVDGYILGSGHHIFGRCVDFLQHIGGGAGDQHIGKGGNAVYIRFRVQLHSLSTQGSTGQFKLNACVQPIFGGLGYLQSAFLQHIIESYGCGLSGSDSNCLNSLGLIPVNDLFCDRISAGPQAFHQHSTAAI